MCRLPVATLEQEWLGEEEVVARCRTSRELADFCLVLAARRIPFAFRHEDGFHVLLAPAGEAERARAEIGIFLEENRDWPPRPHDHLPVAEAGLWFWPLVLPVLFYGASGPWEAGGRIFARGALGRAVIEGEWWRPVTALFLHSGPVHLVSNLVFGWLFMLLLARSIGGGLAWLLSLAAAAAAGAANIALRPDGRMIVGLSTLVFAAAGVLCGLAFRIPGGWRRFLLAAGSGLAFYAMLGAGGVRVDVRSHLFGLAAGLAAGAMLAAIRDLSGFAAKVRVQEWAWLSFGLTVAASWIAAMG